MFGQIRPVVVEFKYITCFGSTQIKMLGPGANGYLNTLHVSVQHVAVVAPVAINESFKYITCFGSTSVQNQIALDLGLFKYITCFGSTSPHPIL